MQKSIKGTIVVLSIILLGLPAVYVYGQNSNFDNALQEVIEPIEKNLNSQFGTVNKWAQWIRDALIYVAEKIMIPLVILIGVLVAIVWFYKLFFSDSEDEVKKWAQILGRGIVGIILMISARWATLTFVGETWSGWVFLDATTGEFNGILLAQGVYEEILYPLLKLGMFLIIGILFVILLIRVFWFIFSPDEDVKKKAWTIIVWNTVGILVILAAQAIVEAIYGKKSQVLNINATDLGDVGTNLLSTKSIPLVYTIINRVLWLTSLVILIIVLYQAFQLLVKPDDTDKIKQIGKSLGYVLIGVVVIGAAYLIVNVLLIQ